MNSDIIRNSFLCSSCIMQCTNCMDAVSESRIRKDGSTVETDSVMEGENCC